MQTTEQLLSASVGKAMNVLFHIEEQGVGLGK